MGNGRGIVLFAHGSRDARWREPVEAVAARIASLDPAVQVRCAYLEAATPDLSAAVAELAGSGAKRVEVLPIFLGVGKHLREDLPGLVAQLQRENPRLELSLRNAIGETPELIEAIAQIALKI